MGSTKPVGVSSVSSLTAVTGRGLLSSTLPRADSASAWRSWSEEEEREDQTAPVISTSGSSRTMNTFKDSEHYTCAISSFYFAFPPLQRIGNGISIKVR